MTLICIYPEQQAYESSQSCRHPVGADADKPQNVEKAVRLIDLTMDQHGYQIDVAVLGVCGDFWNG